jgi:hypothetical protein
MPKKVEVNGGKTSSKQSGAMYSKQGIPRDGLRFVLIGKNHVAPGHANTARKVRWTKTCRRNTVAGTK